MSKSSAGVVGIFLAWATIVIASIAGYVEHIILCIQTNQPLMLIAGCIFAPVGVIHGWGHFLGAW